MSYVKTEVVHKPKKLYRCYLCKQAIESEHVKISTYAEGTVKSIRVHARCHADIHMLCDRCTNRCDGEWQSVCLADYYYQSS